MMRIAVGGIEHESSSFIPRPTPIQAFDKFRYNGDRLRGLGDANDIIFFAPCPTFNPHSTVVGPRLRSNDF